MWLQPPLSSEQMSKRPGKLKDVWVLTGHVLQGALSADSRAAGGGTAREVMGEVDWTQLLEQVYWGPKSAAGHPAASAGLLSFLTPSSASPLRY